MSYSTTNEMDHFLYDEAVLTGINPGLSDIHLILDNVKITHENSKNRDIGS